MIEQWLEKYVLELETKLTRQLIEVNKLELEIARLRSILGYLQRAEQRRKKQLARMK